MRLGSAWWQLRQVLFIASAATLFVLNLTMPPTPLPPPALTWAVPSPWQVEHAPALAGLREEAARHAVPPRVPRVAGGAVKRRTTLARGGAPVAPGAS